MFRTKVVQKLKTSSLCSIFFFFENRAVYEIMWKNIVEWGQAADKIKVHAQFMLGT